MTNPIVSRWHQIVKSGDYTGLYDLIAENAVFHSPVVHSPQVGQKRVYQYLSAAFSVLFAGTFHYVREVVGERDAVLEFIVELEGVTINGVDMMSWNEQGLITDFKVMVRPLKGINLVHQKMAAMLELMKAK